jgi:MFS family permease
VSTQTLASPFPETGPERLDRRAWATLLVLCGAIFLDALDVSMIGVALPSIRADLGMSTSSLQWVVSAYVLGYGGFLLLGGRAADLFGRRRMFILSLAVFVVGSGLGGFATGAGMLIATRFVKGLSAAFTAPAGLSIITTTFAEGPARNKALSIYTATGATGFSLGLVFGGLLTELGWRWVFFLPTMVAAIVLAGATRLVPADRRLRPAARAFDVIGAVALTGAMLLLVFTLVEAPSAGWASLRTIGSFAIAAAILAGFVSHERHTRFPLVRLGILRSASLVRANLAAMTLFGSWVAFQFVLTLYLQQLRGWSALETGLAIFPAGALVMVLSPRIAPLIGRFGLNRMILAGLASLLAGYVLFLPIGLDSGYVLAMLPTFLLAGLGFALAFGPLNVAATSGIEPAEQGLAGGLVNTSFQFGGALFLAVTTAVIDARVPSGASAPEVLDGFHTALFVPVLAAALGVAVIGLRRRARPAPAVEAEPEREELLEAA